MGGAFCYRLGRRINRESDGALDFDGFCWMGGRNNQPKVIRNNRIYFGETARRVMMTGESAVASFGPSNYWTKIKKTKFVVTLGGHQSTIAHNNQPDQRDNNVGGIEKDARPVGNAGGRIFDHSGGDFV